MTNIRIYDCFGIIPQIENFCGPLTAELVRKIGIIKLIAKRIDLQFDNPDIKLSITDSNIDINCKFISALPNIKRILFKSIKNK